MMSQEHANSDPSVSQSRQFDVREAAAHNLKLLLIDDDESFGHLMEVVAAQRGISLEYYPSLVELGRIGRLGDFDVAILDYYLDGMNGIEIAEYLERFFTGKPVVLVSGRSYGDALMVESPRCVKAFVHKVRGALTILDKVVEVASHCRPPENRCAEKATSSLP